ncbi:hypothetical protein [Glaciecola sp. 1036]|uniref:hypothetical protein n=1 Tax=Alteromonadaceae TaxID=72275 RepID=UPI003D004F25
MYFDILKAAAYAGIPVFIFSFLMVRRALASNRLKDFSGMHEFEKSMKDLSKSQKKQSKIPDVKNIGNYALDKWLNYGGGFYGLMVFLTFVCIEIGQVISFFKKLFSLNLSELFSNVSIQLLVKFFIDAIMNLVDAFIWFIYWPKQIDMYNGWVWLGIAYAAYFVGARVAYKFQTTKAATTGDMPQ